MNAHALDINRSRLNLWKIFWLLVSFEAAILLVVLFGNLYLYNDLIFFAYVVGIILTPIFLLLTPIEPTVGLVLMLIATGFDFLGRITRASEGGVKFNLTYFHIALLITFVSTFLNLVLKRRTVIRSTNLWPPLILFYIVLSYSLIYTPNFLDAFVTFVRVVVMGLIALIVIESVDKRWKVSLVMWSMVLIPVAISILTIYQLLTEGAFYAPRVVKMATSLGLAVYRSTGTFDNPNKLACFLMIGILIPFAMMFIKEMNLFTKSILFFSMFITSIGILSTFSRAGWLSTLAGLLLIVAMHRKWSYLAFFLGIVVVATIILSIEIPQLWEVIFDRFASIFDPSSDDSSSSRLSLIRSGIWMWQDHPLFGVGLRGFPKMYYDYVDPNMAYFLMEVNEPHTIQFEILAEEGIIGIVVATWLFFTIFFHGIRTSMTVKNPYLKNAQMACTALFIAFMVNFTFATDMTNNACWMTIGMMYAIPFIDSEMSEKEAANTDSVVLRE